MIWLILLLIFILLNNGLYLPEQWMLPAFFLSIVTFFVFVYKIIRGQFMLPFQSVLIFLIPMLYGCTLFFEVESVEGTIHEIIRWVMIGCIGVYCFYLVGKNRQKAELSMILVGLFLVISTYLAISPRLEIEGFILLLDKSISGSGLRIGGFFQYPNTYGAVIGALFLFTLVFSLRHQHHPRFAMACMLLPSYSFFLFASESRGVWILFAITWFVGVWMYRSLQQQVRYIAYTIIAFSTGVIAYILWENGAYIVLLAVQLIGSIALYLFSRARFSVPNLPPMMLPLVIGLSMILFSLDVVFGGIVLQMLPEAIQQRLSMGAATFSQRLLYVTDLFSNPGMFFLHGAGGNAWENIMYQVQSEPYISHELHNGYADWLLELGVIGFIILTGALIMTTIGMAKAKSIAFLPFLMLFLHGLIDFTFSYSFVLILGICFLAIYHAERSEPTRISVKWSNLWEVKPWLKHAVASLLLILLGASSYFSYQFYQAETAFSQLPQQSTKQEAVEQVRLALDKNPYSVPYRLQLLEIENLSLDEQSKLLEKGLSYETHHARLWFQYGENLILRSKWNEGMEAIETAIRLDQFDVHKYERYMVLLLEAEQRKLDACKEQSCAEKAVHVYKQFYNLSKRDYTYENQRGFRQTGEIEKLLQQARETSQKE